MSVFHWQILGPFLLYIKKERNWIILRLAFNIVRNLQFATDNFSEAFTLRKKASQYDDKSNSSNEQLFSLQISHCILKELVIFFISKHLNLSSIKQDLHAVCGMSCGILFLFGCFYFINGCGSFRKKAAAYWEMERRLERTSFSRVRETGKKTEDSVKEKSWLTGSFPNPQNQTFSCAKTMHYKINKRWEDQF